MPRREMGDKTAQILRDTKITDVARHLGLIAGEGKSVINCLWHEDRHPSLNLYDSPGRADRPHYHCFVCDQHGDSIDLVKKVLGTDFRGARKIVAEVGGFQLPTESIRTDRSLDRFEHGTQERGLQFAWEQYRQRKDNLKLVEWALERHFSAEFLETHEVSWNHGRTLIQRQNKWTREELDWMLESGVLRRSLHTPGGSTTRTGFFDLGFQVYDFFHEDRVLFPIRDTDGRLQGIAGRLVATIGDKKYLYTPGFRRSDSLYGIDRVKKSITTRKSMRGRAKPFHLFIVEGFMDVLRLEYLGLNAVALLGSSLSTSGEQFECLKYLGDLANSNACQLLCHLFLDQDDAGKDGCLRALPKLLDWADRSDDGVVVDVLEFPDASEKGAPKDPDEILKLFTAGDTGGALKVLSEACVPALLFMLARHAGVLSSQLITMWHTLPKATTSEARYRTTLALRLPGIQIRNLSHSLQATLLHAYRPPSWLESIASSFTSHRSDGERKAIGFEDAPDLFRAMYRDALGMARDSVSNREFPSDPASWERLERGLSLFSRLQWDRLSDPDPTEPYFPVLLPRPDGGEPRLKALPSPEDLTLQMYYLTVLLRYADAMPCVISKRDPGTGAVRRETHGLPLPKTMADEQSLAVSFAYQIDYTALHSGSGRLYRHYSECWRDFNTYILNRVKKCKLAQEPMKIYTARLDVRRYYDAIPKYAVVNVVKTAIQHALARENATGNDWLNLLRLDSQLDSATLITEWLSTQVFDYPYLDPKDGSTRNFGPERGIPQGPDLSAWIGTVTLFPVDKVLADTVDEIIRNHARQGQSGLHPTKNESNLLPVATYARYVDDIVLLAPTLGDLNKLRTTLEFELRRVGLELSAKGEPVEPRTPDEFEQWIRHHGGVHPAPSVEGYDGEIIESRASLQLRALLGGLTRAEALGVLYTDSVFESNSETENLPLVSASAEVLDSLQIVARSIDKLRHKDWVKIAEHLWNLTSVEISDGADNALERFLTYWRSLPDHIPLPSVNVLPAQTSEISLETAVDKAWPILVFLEGLEQALARTYNPLALWGKRTRTLRKKAADSIKQWVEQGILELILHQLDKDVRERIFVVIAGRVLSILQYAHVSAPQHICESLRLRCQRRVLGSIQSGLGRQEWKGEHPYLILHCLMVELQHAALQTTHDAIQNVWKSWDSTLRDNTPFPLLSPTGGSQTLLKTEDGLRDEGRQYVDTLNFLLATLPHAKQRELFSTHKHIFDKVCLPEDAQFLPNPEGISTRGLLGVRIPDGDSGAIDTIYKLTITADFSHQNIDLIVPDSTLDWKDAEVHQQVAQVLSCRESKLDPVFSPLPLSKQVSVACNNGIQSKIKLILDLYISLTRLLSQHPMGSVHASAWNVLLGHQNNELKCAMFAWKAVIENPEFYGGEKTARAYASLSAGGLTTIPIPRENAHFWLAGVILGDITDMLWESSKENLSSSTSIQFSKNDSDYLDEHVLRELVWVLRGNNWWSKPGPKHLLEQFDPLRIPIAVQRVLDAAKGYLTLDRQDAQDYRILEIIHLHATRLLLQLLYRSDIHISNMKPGEIIHVMTKLPIHIFSDDSSILNAFGKLSVNSPQLDLGIEYRAVQAWLLVARTFESLVFLAPTPSLVRLSKLLRACCLLRAVSLHLRIIATQLIVGDLDSYALVLRLGELTENDSLLLTFDNLALISSSKQSSSSKVQLARLAEIMRNSTASNTSAITPLGWLILAIVASNASRLLDDTDSCVVRALRILSRDGDSLDVLECVTQIADTEEIQLCESIVDLIRELSVELQRAHIGESNVDTRYEQPREPNTPEKYWPSTENRFDSYFYLHPRDSQHVIVRTGLTQDREMPSIALLAEALLCERHPAHESYLDATNLGPIVVWQESSFNGRLVGIGYISPAIAILSRIQEARDVADSHSTTEQESGVTIKIGNSSVPNTGEGLVNCQAPNDLSKGRASGAPLSKRFPRMAEARELSWKLRRRRYGRHIRVAFLQMQLRDGYHSPFLEVACERMTSKHRVLEEQNWRPSRDETIRQALLEQALYACREFEVDALVLPEYSVRPETVLWLCEQLANTPEGHDLSIWAGTYRLTPGWKPKNSDNFPSGFHEIVDENNSVLSLLSRKALYLDSKKNGFPRNGLLFSNEAKNIRRWLRKNFFGPELIQSNHLESWCAKMRKIANSPLGLLILSLN